MHTTLVLWTMVVIFKCSTVVGEKFPAIDSDNGVIDFTDYRPHKRYKRANINAVTKGLVAAKELLKDAKSLRSKSLRHRRFQKTGDFEKAKEDFFSVNPRNVRQQNGRNGFLKTPGKVITGSIGNRRLLLKSYGEKGNPTLEIIETKFEEGRYADRIIYKPGKS